MEAWKPAVLLMLSVICGSFAQKVIDKVEFVPGTSVFNAGADGIVRVLVKDPAKTSDPGSWGLLCDVSMAAVVPRVLCYEMGFENTGVRYTTTKTATGLSVLVKDVRCTLDQTNPAQFRVSRCSITSPATGCTTSNVVAVQCGKRRPGTAAATTAPNLSRIPADCSSGSASVRLRNGTNSYGRVEILYNGTWAAICNYGFYQKEATVICKMLCKNFTGPGEAVQVNGAVGSTSFHLSDLTCPANANSTNDCKHSGWGNARSSCSSRTNAWVRCDEPSTTTSRVPDVKVTCTGAQAQVTFNKTENPDLKPDMLILHNGKVYNASLCAFNTSENATHVIATFNFTQCAGSNNATLNNSTYTNRILRVFRPAGGIQYETNYSIPITCVVPKKNQGDSANVRPAVVTVPPKIGVDKLAITLKLYRDRRFTQELAPGSTIVRGATMYARVKQTVNVGDNQMNIRSCWATATSNRDATPRRNLITNACPISGVTITNIDSMTQSFSFKAFTFPGQPATLYVHCQTTTCHTTDTNSDCNRNCLSRRRRKRSVDSKSTSSAQVMMELSGPFVVKENPESYSFNSAALPMSSLLSLLCALLLRMF